MSSVKISTCPKWIMKEEVEQIVNLSDKVYINRVNLLLERMKNTNTDFVIVYGDREHFSNIEYFTRYDSRFEESLFILSSKGEKTIVVGNEGYGYSYYIPYEINRVIYKHFSLQGQPRHDTPKLHDIFSQVGITKKSKIGFVCNKYFEADAVEDPKHQYDIPKYIIDELFIVSEQTNVENYTEEITGLPNGIRMVVREAEEIAFLTYQAAKASNVLRRLILAAKPGMTEQEIARHGLTDMTPPQMYPLINVTPESVSLGLRSPQPDNVMSEGEVFGICFSLRGSLCSKVGIGATSEDTICPRLKGKIETFYKKHWEAVAKWYESLAVGKTGGDMYDAAMNVIGAKEFGVTLNPGHYIGMDEWTNSSSYEGSKIPILSGAVMQSDIIASCPDTVAVSICEDTVIVADEKLRNKLKNEYPDVYKRIENHRNCMRENLGIKISEDVLPLTYMNGVSFPYMLDTTQIFTR